MNTLNYTKVDKDTSNRIMTDLMEIYNDPRYTAYISPIGVRGLMTKVPEVSASAQYGGVADSALQALNVLTSAGGFIGTIPALALTVLEGVKLAGAFTVGSRASPMFSAKVYENTEGPSFTLELLSIDYNGNSNLSVANKIMSLVLPSTAGNFSQIDGLISFIKAIGSSLIAPAPLGYGVFGGGRAGVRCGKVFNATGLICTNAQIISSAALDYNGNPMLVTYRVTFTISKLRGADDVGGWFKTAVGSSK